MKRLILSILAVLAIATAVVGCTSDNQVKSPSSSNTELQGTWAATSPDATQTLTYTINGNNWTMTRTSAKGSIQESGTFTLNPTANPKTINLSCTASTYPSDPGVGTTGLGIYQLSGTSLTLEMANKGDARPTSFTENSSITLTKQ